MGKGAQGCTVRSDWVGGGKRYHVSSCDVTEQLTRYAPADGKFSGDSARTRRRAQCWGMLLPALIACSLCSLGSCPSLSATICRLQAWMQMKQRHKTPPILL